MYFSFRSKFDLHLVNDAPSEHRYTGSTIFLYVLLKLFAHSCWVHWCHSFEGL